MGLDLYLRNSDYSSYSRSYSEFHVGKTWITEYYGVTIDINYYYADKTKKYPEISIDELDRLYPNNEKSLKKYKEVLDRLDKKGILALAPLLLHSDCDGEIPYKLCEPMIPLLENIVKKDCIIRNGSYIIPESDNENDYYGLEVVVDLLDMIKSSCYLKDDIIFS